MLFSAQYSLWSIILKSPHHNTYRYQRNGFMFGTFAHIVFVYLFWSSCSALLMEIFLEICDLLYYCILFLVNYFPCTIHWNLSRYSHNLSLWVYMFTWRRYGALGWHWLWCKLDFCWNLYSPWSRGGHICFYPSSSLWWT